MKNRSIVSERGTITIPEPIRRVANIHPGDLVEFKPEKDRIILSHMVIREPGEEYFMSGDEWDKFDKLVQKQFKKGQYAGYTDLDKAKLHSHNLMQKKK